jgi:hypothetical protein
MTSKVRISGKFGFFTFGTTWSIGLSFRYVIQLIELYKIYVSRISVAAILRVTFYTTRPSTFEKFF